MDFLADTMFNPRNWEMSGLMPDITLPNWRLPKVEMPSLPHLSKINIPLPNLPLRSLAKIQNVSTRLFVDFRDWIIAKDVRDEPSLRERIIRWLKDIYNKIIFLFTGRSAPAETNWKLRARRLYTIATRVAIVVGTALLTSVVYRQTGESLKTWGESLVQQAATRGAVRGAGLETTGKGFIALGSLLCVTSNVVQQAVLLPVYYLPKWTMSSVSLVCTEILKPVTTFAVTMLANAITVTADAITWTCTKILGPVLQAAAEIVGAIFHDTMAFLKEAIPLAFDAICYVGNNLASGAEWALRHTVVPLGVAGLKALGHLFDFTVNILQIFSENN